MHRRVSFFAPSSSRVSALTLQLVVAPSICTFPNRTASDGQDSSRVLALPNFVEIASANINCIVREITGTNLRCVPKKSIRRIL